MTDLLPTLNITDPLPITSTPAGTSYSDNNAPDAPRVLSEAAPANDTNAPDAPAAVANDAPIAADIPVSADIPVAPPASAAPAIDAAADAITLPAPGLDTTSPVSVPVAAITISSDRDLQLQIAAADSDVDMAPVNKRKRLMNFGPKMREVTVDGHVFKIPMQIYERAFHYVRKMLATPLKALVTNGAKPITLPWL